MREKIREILNELTSDCLNRQGEERILVEYISEATSQIMELVEENYKEIKARLHK